ncbi:Lipoprotein OS=Streptomyces alboniger OX=132473 GN=CP975_27820 PE=4 SV=1 [Streptomyces alboniger]
MGKKLTAGVTTVLACVVIGGAVTGCSGGSSADEPSAEQLLDDANDTMKALKSVTVDAKTTTVATGKGFSSRLTTDLKGTCRSSRTWAGGARLEQIRIGDADYVRPNRAYLKMAGKDMTGQEEQKRWVKSPASKTAAQDGLSDCTWPFSSFGKVTKGEPTEVDGRPAMRVVATDKAHKGSTYTFSVATEGKPYLLSVVYKGADYHSTTSFNGFDEPLDVRPPAENDVLDASRLADD